MKTTVEDFIKNHKYIDYCEAIIHPDGSVEYANPSHVEALVRISGKDRETIDEMMPIFDAPIVWLTEYTRCIAVYTNGYIMPKTYTHVSSESLKRLIGAGLVANKSML